MRGELRLKKLGLLGCDLCTWRQKSVLLRPDAFGTIANHINLFVMRRLQGRAYLQPAKATGFKRRKRADDLGCYDAG